MALQVFDGFDDYGTTNNSAFESRWASSGGVGVVAQTPGLYGGYGICCANNPAVSLTALPAPGTSMVVGGRLQMGSGNSFAGLVLSNSIADVNSTPTLQLRVFQTPPAPVIQLVNSAATVIGTASSQIMNLGEWYELELLATISTTTGSATVKVNGVEVLSLTNVNTQGSSASSTIGAAGIITMYNGDLAYIDDFYACDTTGPSPANTFLSAAAGAIGPRVYTLFPNSDSSTAWTPLSGSSNYAMVDEQSFDGDTSYIYSSTASQQDLYGIPAVSGVSAILAVKTSYVARMDDAGTREVAGSLESGGTVYQGATTSMTGNYQKIDDYYLVDPATSSAWSPAKFTTSGNIFIGVECVE